MLSVAVRIKFKNGMLLLVLLLLVVVLLVVPRSSSSFRSFRSSSSSNVEGDTPKKEEVATNSKQFECVIVASKRCKKANALTVSRKF